MSRNPETIDAGFEPYGRNGSPAVERNAVAPSELVEAPSQPSRIRWDGRYGRRATGHFPLPTNPETGGPRLYIDGQLYLTEGRLAALEAELAAYKPAHTAQVERLLQQFLKAADATRAYHVTAAFLDRELHRRRRRALRARKCYLGRLEKVQASRDRAAAPWTARLERVDGAITVLEEQTAEILARICGGETPEVLPWSTLGVGTPDILYKATEFLGQTPPEPRRTADTGAPPTGNWPPGQTAGDRRTGSEREPDASGHEDPALVWAAKVALGVPLGLALGVGQGWIEKTALKAFRPEPLLWAGVFATAGCAVIYLLTEGMLRLWAWTAEQCLSEEAATEQRGDRLPRIRLRHTLFPALLTAGVVACEAAVLRNVRISSALVKDPGNILYFLDSMPFVLPAVIFGGMKGWMQGVREFRQRDTVLMQAPEPSMGIGALSADDLPLRPEPSPLSLLRSTPPEEPLPEPAVARQTLPETMRAETGKLLRVLVARGAVLLAQRDRIAAACEAATLPYNRLLDLLAAELTYEAGLTEAERRQLVTAELTAVAEANTAMRQLEAFANAVDPLPSPAAFVTADGDRVLRLGDAPVAGVEGRSGTETPEVSRPASWWERVKKLLRWLMRRE